MIKNLGTKTIKREDSTLMSHEDFMLLVEFFQTPTEVVEDVVAPLVEANEEIVNNTVVETVEEPVTFPAWVNDGYNKHWGIVEEPVTIPSWVNDSYNAHWNNKRKQRRLG